MNKNQIIVLSVSVVAIAAIAFSQLNKPEPTPQINEKSVVTAPVSKEIPQSVQQSKAIDSQTGTSVTGQSSDLKVVNKQQAKLTVKKSSVQERKHDLPSDHQKANTQPREHGHESHSESEHNDSRPPGPPKKPVPTQEGPSAK